MLKYKRLGGGDVKILTKNKFYHTKAWFRMRYYIRLKYKGICQRCGKNGTHVHHIKLVTEANVNDPNVTLNEENLTLLCHDCHNFIHMDSKYMRDDVTFNDAGEVVKRQVPPHVFIKP